MEQETFLEMRDDSSFKAACLSCQDPIITSAGVLCYSIPPNSNDIFFLLGKESGDETLYGKKVWCDFTGGKEQGEDSEDTAAREFFEESLGIVCTECNTNASEIPKISYPYFSTTDSHKEITTCDSSYPSVFSDKLRQGKYTFKVTMCTNHGADFAMERKYNVTFIKQIPWNANLPAEYEYLYSKLKFLRAKSESVTRMIEKIWQLEKTQHEMGQELVYPLLNRQLLLGQVKSFLHIDPRQSHAQNDDLNTLVKVVSLRDYKLIQDSDIWSALVILECQNNEKKQMTLRISGSIANCQEFVDYLNGLYDLHKCYTCLPKSIQNHPSIFINSMGLINVLPQFLEKEAIEFWNIARFKDILAQGGHFRKEYFRTSFLPLMAVILDLFHKETIIESNNCYTVYCNPKQELPSLFEYPSENAMQDLYEDDTRYDNIEHNK